MSCLPVPQNKRVFVLGRKGLERNCSLNAILYMLMTTFNNYEKSDLKKKKKKKKLNGRGVLYKVACTLNKSHWSANVRKGEKNICISFHTLSHTYSKTQ